MRRLTSYPHIGIPPAEIANCNRSLFSLRLCLARDNLYRRIYITIQNIMDSIMKTVIKVTLCIKMDLRWVLIIIFFEILIPPEPFMRDAPHFFYRKYNKNLI